MKSTSRKSWAVILFKLSHSTLDLLYKVKVAKQPLGNHGVGMLQCHQIDLRPFIQDQTGLAKLKNAFLHLLLLLAWVLA